MSDGRRYARLMALACKPGLSELERLWLLEAAAVLRGSVLYGQD